ncbi:unnamed protein product, partial [marine sediment metagenome]
NKIEILEIPEPWFIHTLNRNVLRLQPIIPRMERCNEQHEDVICDVWTRLFRFLHVFYIGPA